MRYSSLQTPNSFVPLQLLMEQQKTNVAGDVRQPAFDSVLKHLAHEYARASQGTECPATEDEVLVMLGRCVEALGTGDGVRLFMLANRALDLAARSQRPGVTEVRPQVLECDVVRFQNNKEKWVALVGLLNGYPYEIFTGLQDDDEGIILPKSVTKGYIVKQVLGDGSKRYDFQFTNTRGYKITVEGLSERFNPEYCNYAKLISGVLRYRMPIEHVIKLVASLQLGGENINNWKNGVERALKKYVGDGIEEKAPECPQCGQEMQQGPDGSYVCTHCH